jgi:hypothetical protein
MPPKTCFQSVLIAMLNVSSNSLSLKRFWKRSVRSCGFIVNHLEIFFVLLVVFLEYERDIVGDVV